MTRMTLALAAAASLALLLLTPANGQPASPAIDELLARVEQARLRAHIAAIDEPRSALPAELHRLEETAGYVQSQLESFGYDVTLQPVEFDSDETGQVTSSNVIAIKDGAECPERIFVVGSHYDSVPETPGADDDASGTAAMLEIARALADTDLPATVYFTGFTFEELGLVGSRVMADDFAARHAQVVGMYSLEMVGFTDPATSAEFILALGNETSAPLLGAVEQAKMFVPGLPIVTLSAAGGGETSPDTRRSDHAPFWDAGYQAMLVTDTANFRNPNYHQPSDTLDTINLPFATNVTRAMLATTVLYLTRDDNADGRADVCSAPLLATATPAASATAAPAAGASPTPTARAGVLLPDTGTGGPAPGPSPLWLALAVAALATALLFLRSLPRRS